ncbi:unnamed protein product [Periconia digitata]|uniref:Uncharacterized protein n=1 Tax=Periconia digitata TaxID=1303443 RepID=A0A9W4UAZ8_9PLEO|nr:unnamed protein product [Periconia digitata]
MFRQALLPRTASRFAAPLPTRFVHTTPAYRLAAKHTQDKDSLDPQSNEYSKSGSDQATASSSAAFDPQTTSPEGAERQAEQEGGGNSLDVSPGNADVSQSRGDQEGGAQGSPRTSASGGGSPPKAGGGKSG